MSEATLPVVNGERSMALTETLVPRNLIEIKELASFLAASDLIPKSLMGRKENVALVLLMGHEIGCGGVAALRNIYVVNGRPSIYGDLATALVRKSGLCEELEYSFEGKGDALKCIATGKRKGMKNPHTEEFSMSDAVLGGLVEKNPNYKKFPKDMIMWKALHRLYKFLWSDVLNGISIKEVVNDDVTEAEVVGAVEIIHEPIKGAEALASAKTAEPTAEEMLKKAEEAKARVAAEEAKEKAKAEKKAAKAKMAAEPKPSPAQEAINEIPADEDKPKEELESDDVEAEPVNRAIGTLLTAVKLLGEKPEDILGYALKVATSDGDQKFKLPLEDAKAAKQWVGKTVEIIWKPLEKAIENVVGEVVSLRAVNP